MAAETHKPERMMDVSVWRGGPDGGAFKSFKAPQQESQTILDVVTYIQQNEDPSLAYRFACRVGMCGSCAMMVNGQPRWTCRTHVQKVLKDNKLEIAPLRNLPVIRDLATDMTVFFDKWTAAEASFTPTITRHDPMAPINPETPNASPPAKPLSASTAPYAMPPAMPSRVMRTT